METIAQQIIDFTIECLEIKRKELSDTPQKIVRRTTMQAGVIDSMKLTFKNKNKEYFLEVETGYKKYTRKEIPGLETLSQEEIENTLVPLLKKMAEDKIVASYDNDLLINFYFRIIIGFQTNSLFNSYTILDHIGEEKKKRLLENIEKYIDTKIINGKHPNKQLEIFFLAQHIVDTKLYPSLSFDRIKLIFEKVTELNKHKKNDLLGLQRDLMRRLEQWALKEFFPRYFKIDGPDYNFTATLRDNVKIEESDTPLIDIVIYASILILKYAPSYSRDTGKKYLNMLSELGFKDAKEILKSGSNTFDKADKYYKDENLECLANDVFATFTINIKNESADSYNKAIDFICNLQQKGFPKSYQIKFKSSAKNLLPIKKIGKSKTQQFFANALQYPELYDKIEQYASIVTEPDYQYEWYEDVEAEFCAKPGTYAVFGLGLTDIKYLPIVRKYMKNVDEEHQEVQNYFTNSFIEKWGVSPETIPAITDCILVCHDHKPLKLSAKYETEENLKAFIKSLEGLEDYYVSHLIFFIWGKTADFEKSKKKTSETIRLLLLKIEELADMKYLG
ncbi:MAG: DUF6138 family protein [Dysgonomonas sp.]|nr:DUF6138 family protein [Dysgonomonas sp.]